MKLRAGFTLIEMIIVISIITILIGSSALGYSRYQQNARDTRRRSDLEQIRAALELFRSNDVNSSYPPSVFNMYLTSIDDYFGGSVDNIPKDPVTNNDYPYEALPQGCIGTAVCNTYTLTADLELNPATDDCVVNPNRGASECQN
ncbi:hypothetical protein A3A93_04065 [Candidatus Roizmanbacteria bacterium RIFCSPLOWO2_01_FULL_38_12]|uniref:Type II secretion system protein GspG C-terminal domain-containing protein n=1 Tax=Candidatus Roizmanbacteria bacterium RIFCSPLOWO2_01_FULL_38_12 TaxID=1802061 RepID=A0A1F7IUZ0_9BACT|nr:MAG: hypothetical protein A2861_00560 [Candidatus Roizmanbacteria bacterium RIFCSPHIGHO2_01_FULL_38_15]OGK35027.1 MAG: hypothetical protein A3F59_00240 [Candidatus Roizmanbacteria bacterium RIFCSPHIGHO2_12_FULL_38_13]OGK47182.1 MAG: hypothetical protein A3A93_04065 [Candidatus Roizmanbacteria bacterium RIFCSPLOWO2_01_FULL_38_12]